MAALRYSGADERIFEYSIRFRRVVRGIAPAPPGAPRFVLCGDVAWEGRGARELSRVQEATLAGYPLTRAHLRQF